MAAQSTRVDGVVVVHLQGELDHHEVEKIRDQIERDLASSHHRALVLSLRGIDFMDSSGLGLILGRYRSISSNQGRMALCEVNPNLHKLFELSGIFKVLPVYDTEEAAIRAVKEV